MKKRFIIITAIIIFALNFLGHFMFEWFPNDIIAVFFPTNESIFQHMKMIFTTYFIFYFILFVLRKKLDLENVFLADLVSSITAIAVFLLVYLPVYFAIGENMIFTFILLFITILISQIVGSYFMIKKEDKNLEILSIIFISIIFIISGYLTFHPIENFFFYDTANKTYGRVIK